MLVHVNSGSYDKLPPGAYPGVFKGIEKKETKNGECFLWTFTLDNGKRVTRFTGEPGQIATIGNRYGKWLCALAGKPIGECDIDPDFYVGRRYTCIVGAEGILEAFTPIG